ncbi:DUF1631 family protein [Solimonas sp. SE-A11]|uniref:DUF1631 family protein n=1 Tax=Solimonas sp. SE-A11 TaxID=3054954 RepID=UPI00259C9430|nr:DUF1631 family protein [Solimonas sp. SE-A11]MDM4769784.1 DUF1631 family protein [Solimonas sp. SE-A11]
MPTATDAKALLGELCMSLLAEMDGRLQSMMQAADTLLFELARGSPPTQLPGFLNARHLLRSEGVRATLTASFREALQRRLNPATARDTQAQQLALRGNDEVEDSIRLADMAVRAGSSCEAQIQDLSSRFDTLRGLLPDFPPVASLTPLGLCEAFASAVGTLPDSSAARSALNRLFEQTVLAKLRPVYAEAVASCERHGILPTTRRGRSTENSERATASMLQKVRCGESLLPGEPGSAASGFLPDFSAGFSDADLAQLLLQALQGQAATGFDLPQTRLMKQRASLVGRMIDEILDDPQIPPRLYPLIEAFRFPAIKAALADASFFTNRQHPVRVLINDMADMAGDTRIGGADALQRFDGWARRVLRQADLAAGTVHERLAGTQPLAAGEVEAFLLEQGRQQQERHKALLRKVREVVDQELELCTATSGLPDPVWPLLRSGWGPMMASHLLHHGPDSQVYRSGMELLHRVLQALNPETPNARTPAERATLRVDLFKALTAVGMPRERAHELLKGLDQALNGFSRQDPPGTGAASVAAAPAMADWEPLSATMEITLKRPSRPLPEPAPARELPTEAELAALARTTEIVRELQAQPLATAVITRAETTSEALPEAVTADTPAEEAALADAIADAIMDSVANSAEISEEVAAEAAEIAAVFAEPGSEAEEDPADETTSAGIVSLPLELPTPQRLLEQLLRVGAWFRVYDRRSQGTRWLKLNSWFPQVKRASFTEFDGHNGLTVTAADLLEDLLEGRSEPIDIPPQTVLVLQALRQQHADHKNGAAPAAEEAPPEAAPSSLVA